MRIAYIDYSKKVHKEFPVQMSERGIDLIDLYCDQIEDLFENHDFEDYEGILFHINPIQYLHVRKKLEDLKKSVPIAVLTCSSKDHRLEKLFPVFSYDSLDEIAEFLRKRQ